MRVKVVRWGPFLPAFIPLLAMFFGMAWLSRQVDIWWLRTIGLLAMTALTALMIRVRRGTEALIEWDEIGIRCHGGADSWDVPWGLLERFEVSRGPRRVLTVHAPQVPGQPFRIPNPVPGDQPPTRPAVAYASADQPRRVIKSWRLRWSILALAGAVLSALIVLGTLSNDLLGLSALGVLAVTVAATLFGLTPIHLVVDQFGVRSLGEKRWQLVWSQIAAAQIINGALVITPAGDDQPTMQITDGQPLDQAIRKLDRRFLRVRVPDEQIVPVQELIDHYAQPRWRST